MPVKHLVSVFRLIHPHILHGTDKLHYQSFCIHVEFLPKDSNTELLKYLTALMNRIIRMSNNSESLRKLLQLQLWSGKCPGKLPTSNQSFASISRNKGSKGRQSCRYSQHPCPHSHWERREIMTVQQLNFTSRPLKQVRSDLWAYVKFKAPLLCLSVTWFHWRAHSKLRPGK